MPFIALDEECFVESEEGSIVVLSTIKMAIDLGLSPFVTSMKFIPPFTKRGARKLWLIPVIDEE